MSHRTLKRVPLNFQWPIGKVWKGYINHNPGPRICTDCDGSGYNAATKKIADEFYDHNNSGLHAWHKKITQDEVQALVNKNRLTEFTHTRKPGEKLKRREDGYIPTAVEVNSYQSVAGIFSHDCINRHILVETRARRLGVFGKCPRCKGNGETKLPRKMKKRHNNWREYDPPAGIGYQLWETCSEGSPQSPVFATPEELADWCAENATIFAYEKAPKATWLKMFGIPDGVDMGSVFIGGGGYAGSFANSPMYANTAMQGVSE